MDTKKAGANDSGLKRETSLGLLSQQHVARVLDRLRDRALMTGREMGVLARQDLAGIGHVAAHDLRRGKWDLVGRQTLLRGLFRRGAHVRKRGSRHRSDGGMSTRIFEVGPGSGG